MEYRLGEMCKSNEYGWGEGEENAQMFQVAVVVEMFDCPAK